MNHGVVTSGATHGVTPEEHLHNLNEVLQHLESAGLHLKKSSVHSVFQKLTTWVTQLVLRD